MIKKTRLKIVLVTMAILLAVFAAIGAVTFTLMVTRPQSYPFQHRPGGTPPPIDDAELEDAIKEVESQLAAEWLKWYSIFAGAGLAALFVIICFLSAWIVKPVRETMEKQKQFISDASHEIKTPIAIISANADAMAANDMDNKWLSNIRAQTERMRLLTNDLLVLTRMDEEMPARAEPLNLSEAVTAAALPFESVAFEAGKKLTCSIAPDIMLTADAEDITKAVNILIDNAVKYSDGGGTIRLSLSKQNGKAMLEVWNSGSGISESERAKIFDRFYRSDYSRARKSGGNGLGLSILKGLAEKRGWKLSVTSDTKTHTCFTICF